MKTNNESNCMSKYNYSHQKHLEDAGNYYRKLAGFEDDVVLEEGMLRNSFVDRTCSRMCVTPEELSKVLLCK